MPDMVGVAWSPVIVVDKVRTGRIRKNPRGEPTVFMPSNLFTAVQRFQSSVLHWYLFSSYNSI